MLTEVRKQVRVTRLAIKYALMKEMLNKVTFTTNIVFMLLNNASFIIQWVVLYSLKDNVGGYSFKQVLLLWGLAALTYGFSRFFFKRAFTLSDIITSGKLDAFLVQPKNVLVSAITTDVEASALGDMLYGYIMLCIFGLSIKNIFLFTLFGISGGLILTSVAVIFGSLSFWFNKADMIADTGNGLTTNFATYPEGIFKGSIKILFYTIIPIGFANYLPLSVMSDFNIYNFAYIILFTSVVVALAFLVFERGLRRYSSTNLMSARI